MERTVQVLMFSIYRLFLAVARLSCGPLLVILSAESPEKYTLTLKGEILSAFSLGYLLTQIPGGVLAGKYGAKPFATAALGISGACMVLMPWVSGMERGVKLLWCCEFIMGISQGPSFPLNAVWIGKWVPKQERGWAASLGESGSVAGAFFAMGVSTWMGEIFGWRATSTAIGAAVLSYMCIWIAIACDDPAKSCRISAQETKLLLNHRRSVPDNCRSVRSVAGAFANKSVLAIFAAHGAYNFGRYMLLAWMPTYLKTVLNVDPAAAGLCLILPEFSGALTGIVTGSLGDFAQQRGYPTAFVRRAFSVLGFAGASLALLVMSAAGTSLYICVACLCVFTASHALHCSGYKASYLDVGGQHLGGTLAGAGNTFASLSAYCGPKFAAAVLASRANVGGSSSGWSLVFFWAAAINIAGAAVFAILIDDKPLRCDERVANPPMKRCKSE